MATGADQDDPWEASCEIELMEEQATDAHETHCFCGWRGGQENAKPAAVVVWESWQSTTSDTKHLEAALRRRLDKGSVDMAVDSHVNSYVDISRGCWHLLCLCCGSLSL